MIFTKTFPTEQQAEMEAAHVEICRLIGFTRSRYRSLTDQQVEEHIDRITRAYPLATFGGLLTLLKDQIARLHGQIAECVEFPAIGVPCSNDLIASSDEQSLAFVALTGQHSACVEEIAFVQMCLGYGLRQGACC